MNEITSPLSFLMPNNLSAVQFIQKIKGSNCVQQKVYFAQVYVKKFQNSMMKITRKFFFHFERSEPIDRVNQILRKT